MEPTPGIEQATTWSRRGVLGLAGLGLAGAAGTAMAALLPETAPTDSTRDPDLLPGDAAHARHHGRDR